jgi:LuxR family transcriptional regulator, quorum-sensing system regulator SolR
MSSIREVDYDDALTQIGQAANKEELLAALSKTAAEMGFDDVTSEFIPSRVTRQERTYVSTYSASWIDECLRLPLSVILRDPVLQHLDAQITPIVWGRNDYLNTQLGSVYEMFSGYGVGSGMALAIRGTRGDYTCLGFSSANEQVIKAGSLSTELGKLFLTATAAYTALSRITLVDATDAQDIQLTRRELEILKWSRAGKTAMDCGQILGISQSTVHFHLKNTLQKLDAASKQQAVLKALEMRLIH